MATLSRKKLNSHLSSLKAVHGLLRAQILYSLHALNFHHLQGGFQMQKECMAWLQNLWAKFCSPYSSKASNECKESFARERSCRSCSSSSHLFLLLVQKSVLTQKDKSPETATIYNFKLILKQSNNIYALTKTQAALGAETQFCYLMFPW